MIMKILKNKTVIIIFILIATTLITLLILGPSLQKNNVKQPQKAFEEFLGTVCKGVGSSQMPSYTNHSGIHPIVIYETQDQHLHIWDGYIENSWRPSSNNPPELVLCIELMKTKIGSCSYQGSGATGALNLIQFSNLATLRDARTGLVIASNTFKGKAPTCPSVSTVGAIEEYGEYPEFEDAKGWLSQYVQNS
jgi:hypothetical protein